MGLTKKIDHLGIAVHDVDAAVATFTRNFGFPVESLGDIAALGIRSANLRVGDALLEFFTPKNADHPVAKFLAERGEGMYLLSLEVDDLAAAARELEAKGISVTVVDGPNGDRLGFLGPGKTHGVLLELIQKA